jgi:hypothetical protein
VKATTRKMGKLDPNQLTRPTAPLPDDGLFPSANTAGTSAPGHLCKDVECLVPNTIVGTYATGNAEEVPLTEDTLKYLKREKREKERREALAVFLDTEMDKESKY